jgi:biotin synthase
MAGIGPFIAHPDTPLKDASPGSTLLTRRAIAATRMLIPDINLPATTSLEVRDLDERNKVFSGGANVIMKKVTPEEHRYKYEIYPVAKGKIKSVKGKRPSA